MANTAVADCYTHLAKSATIARNPTDWRGLTCGRHTEPSSRSSLCRVEAVAGEESDSVMTSRRQYERERTGGLELHVHNVGL